MNTSRHQDIAFGITGQSLVWDCPEGRPSSVTSVAVYAAHEDDTGTAESATTGSASVETNPNTTVDAASGAGQANPRLLNVAATTGFAKGREYLVTGADGESEEFEILEIDSGVSVTARHPLHHAYASADTVVSTRISISVDSTWVADQSNLTPPLNPRPGYRVRWVYVVSSVTHVHDNYFSLKRYAGGHQVTPAMLDSMYPNYADVLPTYHRDDQGARMIDEAYEQVKWDLHASDVDDAAVRSVDALNRATMLRFGAILAEEQGPEMLDLRERRYREFFDRIFRVTNKVDLQVTDSGGAANVPALPLMVK